LKSDNFDQRPRQLRFLEIQRHCSANILRPKMKKSLKSFWHRNFDGNVLNFKEDFKQIF